MGSEEEEKINDWENNGPVVYNERIRNSYYVTKLTDWTKY